MARPKRHDGVVFRRKGSKLWWMRYCDRSGQRHRESTLTENWQEAQKRLRERLLARDDNVLEVVRRWEGLTFRQWVEHFLTNYFAPPVRAEKTHAVNVRVAKLLNVTFGPRKLGEMTADEIELFLRVRLRQGRRFKTLKGIQRNRSRKTQHSSSGISGSSPLPECCSSQTALTFESLLWGGVSGRCERNVSTALRSLVGAAKNRVPCTGVSVQCDSNRHGDRHAHL